MSPLSFLGTSGVFFLFFVSFLNENHVSKQNSPRCFTLDNRKKVHIVLFSSTVIFTAVSYDAFNSHYIISSVCTCIYVNMFAQKAVR